MQRPNRLPVVRLRLAVGLALSLCVGSTAASAPSVVHELPAVAPLPPMSFQSDADMKISVELIYATFGSLDVVDEFLTIAGYVCDLEDKPTRRRANCNLKAKELRISKSPDGKPLFLYIPIQRRVYYEYENSALTVHVVSWAMAM